MSRTIYPDMDLDRNHDYCRVTEGQNTPRYIVEYQSSCHLWILLFTMLPIKYRPVREGHSEPSGRARSSQADLNAQTKLEHRHHDCHIPAARLFYLVIAAQPKSACRLGVAADWLATRRIGYGQGEMSQTWFYAPKSTASVPGRPRSVLASDSQPQSSLPDVLQTLVSLPRDNACETRENSTELVAPRRQWSR
ncbi:hypothetical protein CHU98_g9182 [Xylaria longipes]|nr:hypothetical protein CHU98_g9182 [Xylaria longipes]